MYIARIYEKIIEKKNIYHRKLLKIPVLHFIVLYNGKEECPDHQELRLSASFKNTELISDKIIFHELEPLSRSWRLCGLW